MKTIAEQIESVQREIGMRMRVYPAWIKKGSMTQSKAAHEIACMEEVHRTLTKVQREQESVGKPDLKPMVLAALTEANVDTTIDDFTPPKLRALLKAMGA